MRAYEFILLELTDKVKNLLRDRYQQENPDVDPHTINSYIDKWDRYSGGLPAEYRDITRLNFQQVERLIDDAETRVELKGRGEQTPINPQDDLIYDKNNLTIFRGDMREKCIQYGKGYSWCISRKDASNLYNTYRYGAGEPSFYFVFDKDRPRTDKMHAIVVYKTKDDKFFLATARNTGDTEVSWEKLESMQPKLQGLQNLFVSNPLNDAERADYKKYGRRVSDEVYANMSLKQQYKYIQFQQKLTPEQQESTPRELIGVYAKMNPMEITRSTLDRLSSGDLRKVIQTILGTGVTPKLVVDFTIKTLGVPWKDSEFPYSVIQAAETKIRKYWPKNESDILAKPEKAYKYAAAYKGRWPEAEQVLVDNPKFAVLYARDVLKGSWPEAETAIMKRPERAITYAAITGKRDPVLEKKLIKTPEFIIKYAVQVMKGRWPEAEPRIMQSCGSILYYAMDVIKGRWLEAEQHMLEKFKDPRYDLDSPICCFQYALMVINGRWPEAEPYIKKNPGWWKRYQEEFGNV